MVKIFYNKSDDDGDDDDDDDNDDKLLLTAAVSDAACAGAVHRHKTSLPLHQRGQTTQRGRGPDLTVGLLACRHAALAPPVLSPTGYQPHLSGQ